MLKEILRAFVEGFGGGLGKSVRDAQYKQEFGRFFKDFTAQMSRVMTKQQSDLMSKWIKDHAKNYNL